MSSILELAISVKSPQEKYLNGGCVKLLASLQKLMERPMSSARKISMFSRIQQVSAVVAALMSCLLSSPAFGQATSRQCESGSIGDEQAGPACLLSHESLGKLNVDSVYWSLDKYPDVAAAQRDKALNGSVVKAFGSVWLFTVGPLGTRSPNGEHVAQIGPIAVDKNTSYDAEFLKSTFSPGMTAPIHVHSGPEAFYAVSGDSCLETPDGVQVGRGPGNSMVVRGGPPMLLMALGPEPRKGFALILHDSSLKPTTLVHDWTPKGLCQAAMR
jgi:quercetin dioxygenase-like cupin family protein